MGPILRLDFSACFLLALGILILPPDWLFGAILAAVIHELCHFCMARFLGVNCTGIRISAAGFVMELVPMNRHEELLTSAAGPVGSLLLLVLVHVYPQLAVCGAIQGLYNLLPIWPLDGGRILRCILPGREGVFTVAEWCAGILIMCAGLYLAWKLQLGFWPIGITGFITGKAFLRKIPCKDAVLGVQ